MARNFGGIGQGILAGAQLGMQFQDRKDRKEREDADRSIALEERADRRARQAVIDDRASAEYANTVATDQQKGAINKFTNIASQYGTFEAAPPEVQQAAVKDAEAAEDAIGKAHSRRNALAFGQEQQELTDIMSNLKTGRVQLDDVPADKLYLALANATMRDPADFMQGPDGSPSPVAKAVGDITTGMETGNEGMVNAGANVILAPELRKGVGTDSAHGGKIVGKEIVRLVPHPQNPELVTPVVRVYVDGGQKISGPRGPHNATSYYDAPLTQNRSSDPNDPVKFINLKQAMDRVGQMGMLTEVMNQPDFRKRVEEGREAAGGRTKALVDNYFAQGAAAAPKKQLSTKEIRIPADGGFTLRETTDPQGRVVGSERIQHPDRAARTGAIDSRLAAIGRMRESGEFNDAEADEAEQAAFGIRPRAPRGGGGGGGAAKPGRIPEAAVNGAIKDAVKALAGDLGLRYSGISKSYVKSDGSPASAADLQKLDRSAEKVSTVMRDSAAGGKLAPLTDALNAARSGDKTDAKPKTVKWGDLK